MPSRSSRPGWPGAGESQDPFEAGDEDRSPTVFDDGDDVWPASSAAPADPFAPRGRMGMVLPLPPAGTLARVKGAVAGQFARVFHGGVFARSERNWQGNAVRRQVRLVPALCLALAVLAVAGTFAFVVASRAASRATPPQAKVEVTALAPGGLTLQAPRAVSPTPQAAPYQIGAWFGTAMTLGSAQVFVRISHDSSPVAGVPVTLSLSVGGSFGGYGPVLTDAYGLAVFNVVYAPVPDRPGHLIATATVNGQAFTFDMTFITIHQDTTTMHP